MKNVKITYWTTTVIVGLIMFYSAYAYLTSQAMVQAFHHLGFPDYFRTELAVAKIIGGIGLLAPISSRFKEYVYTGFVITFVSAFIAHSTSGDPVSVRVTPLILLVLLAVSYVAYRKNNDSAK